MEPIPAGWLRPVEPSASRRCSGQNLAGAGTSPGRRNHLTTDRSSWADAGARGRLSSGPIARGPHHRHTKLACHRRPQRARCDLGLFTLVGFWTRRKPLSASPSRRMRTAIIDIDRSSCPAAFFNALSRSAGTRKFRTSSLPRVLHCNTNDVQRPSCPSAWRASSGCRTLS
jgi:hypothetical protein